LKRKRLANSSARQILTAAGLCFAIMTLGLPAADGYAAVISGASIESHDKIVELHFKVRGHGLKWHLNGHGQRLWIELDHAKTEIPAHPLNGQEQLPVTLVSAIDSGAGHAQIGIEVSGRVDYAIASLPHELVVRLAPAGTVPNLAAPLLVEMDRTRRASTALPARRTAMSNSSGRAAQTVASVAPPAKLEEATITAAEEPATLPRGAAVPSVAADAEDVAPARVRPVAITPPHPHAGRPLVVIDPGHGGRDPGTEASDNVAEKDLALRIATHLRMALESRGINAELTRADDTFLSLAERTTLANRAHADLFISIHLNFSPDANTAGIETYYLNNTTDRATIRLARMENSVAGGYSAPGQPNLDYILTDLRQGYKANESASLARMIEAESVADLDASLGVRVNALGAKQGPFYVLVGAEMPSVLVECGFLSNPAETQNLVEPRYQQALADGVAAAVIHYFNADAAVGNL
jgi:N-acetylmuramoyl-L-alanine amidase